MTGVSSAHSCSRTSRCSSAAALPGRRFRAAAGCTACPKMCFASSVARSRPLGALCDGLCPEGARVRSACVALTERGRDRSSSPSPGLEARPCGRVAEVLGANGACRPAAAVGAAAARRAAAAGGAAATGRDFSRSSRFASISARSASRLFSAILSKVCGGECGVRHGRTVAARRDAPARRPRRTRGESSGHVRENELRSRTGWMPHVSPVLKNRASAGQTARRAPLSPQCRDRRAAHTRRKPSPG